MSRMVRHTALCAALAALSMVTIGCGEDEDPDFDKPTDGPEQLFSKTTCDPTTIDGWDPANPWPLVTAAIFDGSYTLADTKIPDDTKQHTCTRFGDVWVWGWKPGREGPEKIYDGPVTDTEVAKLKGFAIGTPRPVIAMFHHDDAWYTSEFFKVLADGSVQVNPDADRVVVWEFRVLAPQVFWRGPRKKLNIPWKTGAPRPMMPFAIQPDVHIEYDPIFILKSDGSYPSALEDEEIVWGW